MKSIFEQVIQRGSYDLAGLLKNIDRYHVEHKLTDAEREQLYEQARAGAEPRYDAGEEIRRLWEAVHALEAEVTRLSAAVDNPVDDPDEPDEPEAPVDEYPPYVQPAGAHDAYHLGDKVSYNGQHYICALEGCVWAPDVYPAGWNVEG